MKKMNDNFLVFLCVALLIVGGLFSRPMLSGLKNALVDFVKAPDAAAFIKQVNEASKNVSYKGSLLDLYSLYYRMADVRLVEKPDQYDVVRMENDYLCFSESGLDGEILEEMGDRCAGLKAAADSVDAEFLYVMAPTKLYYENTADGAESIARQTYTAYADVLTERGIRVLDLAEQMARQSIAFEDAYFITDHHWLPETGFWAAEQILEALHIPYDQTMCDMNNYDVAVYEDWFLGSLGRRVGRYFTPLGVDDISLITPKFDTDLTVTDSRGTLTGSFGDTLLDMDEITKKDYYNKNPYAAYSGGDFGFQLIQNNRAAEGAQKILVLRDSFACCVTPFLALHAETTHVLDVRYWEGTETVQSIPDYIKSVDPDCVVILYAVIDPSMTDF